MIEAFSMNALCLYYHLKYPSLEGFSLTQLAVWCLATPFLVRTFLAFVDAPATLVSEQFVQEAR
jgi:hypothetical protein